MIFNLKVCILNSAYIAHCFVPISIIIINSCTLCTNKVPKLFHKVDKLLVPKQRLSKPKANTFTIKFTVRNRDSNT